MTRFWNKLESVEFTGYFFYPKLQNYYEACFLILSATRIQQLKPEAHPEDQVHVVVWVKSLEPDKQKSRGE